MNYRDLHEGLNERGAGKEKSWRWRLCRMVVERKLLVSTLPGIVKGILPDAANMSSLNARGIQALLAPRRFFGRWGIGDNRVVGLDRL